eukprot:g11217.t1
MGLGGNAEACPEWKEVLGEDWESIGEEQEQQIAAVIQGFVAAAMFGVRVVRDLFVLSPAERALLQKACRSASKKTNARHTKVRQQALVAAAPGVHGTPGNPWTNGLDSESEAIDDENDDDDLFFLNLRSADARQDQASGLGGSSSAAAAAVQCGLDKSDFEKGGSAMEDGAARTLPQPLANPGKGKLHTCAAEDELGPMGGCGETGQSQTQMQMQTQTQTQEMAFSEAVQHSQEVEQGSSSSAGLHGPHVAAERVQ